MTADDDAGKDMHDRSVPWRCWGTLAALAPLGFGLQALCALAPESTERIYARGIYPLIARVLTTLSSPSPIAVGETLLLLVIGYTIVRVARGVLAWRRRQRRLANLALHALAQSAAAFGVGFLLFQLLWGLNHARLPFATQVDLHVTAVEPARLARVVDRLAERAAAVRPADSDPLTGYLTADWRERIADAYDAAGATWPVLAGPRPTIRAPLISRLMTLGSVTGIYSPFTGEPNVNDDMPEVLRPFVACHESAHLRGYAREDEANFIAWWVGSRSPDRATAYSCELMAWRIAMAQLHAVDYGAWTKAGLTAPEVIRDDDRAIREFWLGQPAAVHHILTTITETTNDLYLRSSGHAEGVRSYGRAVDLLIAALDDG